LFGVYIHVPFCRRRCDYCAFATWTDRDHLQSAYVDACIAEVAQAAPGLPAATSVFVGGGTPSRLDGAELARLLRSVDIAPGAEVTVECNPEDATAELFDTWLSAGVTRVSFGVQSMRPHVLTALGRVHDVASVRRAVPLAASAGFVSWSVDLIYGAVGESIDDWAATLHDVLSLSPPPPHVSAYALTVEPGTPLARSIARHPDDDDQAEKYELAESMLSAAGLHWYEISNWARGSAHECRHNSLYWAGGEYRGIGCAAHSHVGGRRWWNVRTPERYIDLVAAGASAEAGSEMLDATGRAREAAELSLRTRQGVPVSLVPGDVVDAGLVSMDGGRAVLTVAGRLLANEVAVRLRPPSGG
jgi:oxygen-independent coproporphyrinogen-3 oxidase